MKPNRFADICVLAATVTGSSLAIIDATAVNVALPAIQKGFDADITALQWVVESYALFLGALILIGGVLGDHLGRKRLFAIGVVIFAVASAWCGLAADIPQLIIARAVQGVGAALVVPGSLALLSAHFSEEQRGRAIGQWASFTTLAIALGPVLGGVLVDVGHGAHFDFNIARSAIAQGVVPYTLGADMHGYNVTQPGEGKASALKSANPFFGVAPFSLCIAMTELLMLGMDFTDVVKTVTCNAAIIAGMQNEIGTLKRGRDADVSVIDIKPGSWKLSDNSGNHVISDKIIVPRFTLRMGERFEANSPLLPPPVKATAKEATQAKAA